LLLKNIFILLNLFLYLDKTEFNLAYLQNQLDVNCYKKSKH